MPCLAVLEQNGCFATHASTRMVSGQYVQERGMETEVVLLLKAATILVSTCAPKKSFLRSWFTKQELVPLRHKREKQNVT
mmetsp:Transcript_49224/g.87901  ORF Transcript_49224/g.87901 Transcript_49224/m.87901 type:complete len:80 (-) Transcript_49224:1585-1824(-)